MPLLFIYSYFDVLVIEQLLYMSELYHNNFVLDTFYIVIIVKVPKNGILCKASNTPTWNSFSSETSHLHYKIDTYRISQVLLFRGVFLSDKDS